MSFSSEYFKLRKKQLEEEEKKTDNAIKITRDYDTDTYSYLGIRGKQIEENKKKAENPTWFKESEADNFAGAASATTGDAFQHFIEGIVNIPNLVVDAFAAIGNAMAKSQLAQSRADRLVSNSWEKVITGEGQDAKEIMSEFKSYEDSVDKVATEFIKGELYDAEEVSKNVVANLGSAAYMYGINQSGQFATPEQVAFSQKLAQDSYKYVDEDMQKNSVLGDKSDSLVASGGQLAGTAALTAMGVPPWLVIGSTAMGGEVENALNQGATMSQATMSGLISAGAEILTEKFSGGIDFGMGTLDDGLTKKIATKISNKALQTLAKFGMDVVGEGGEEVASQFISNLGSALYREENLGEILASEKALQEYLDSFIGGAVLGGVSSGGKIVNSAIKGTNVVTEHTKNEQKVFDYEFNKRVTEQENKGEKLTNKDKAQIRAEIFEDMENGNIDISDIEEALGGDSYKAYKSESDNTQKLKAEYDELAKMEGGKRTYLQDKRLAELDKMDFNDTSKADGLKKTMSDEVYNLVRGDRGGQGSILMESYRENAKTHQAFQADYAQYKGTKYEDAAKQTIDNAMKAGANDTRKVHNIVDMAAKLSSETGVVYEFGSNETIKEDFIKLQSEKIAKLEAIENPTPAQTKALSEMKDVLQKVQNGSVKVNGNITSKGVMLNLDSHKALNRVVGHELTHTLEKTAHYEKLQSALFEYAKAKGVKVDEKLKELESLYAGVEGDAKAELTADLVGDYLFNDYDFVKRLSTDKNLFQKVWDEIKYIAKMAKPGSKEARALAKVERMFEKAFQESAVAEKVKKQETDAASGDAAFSLVYSKEIEDKSNNYFAKNKPEHISQEMYDAANETIQEMVDYMKPYLDITNNNGKRFLPEEIVGNTIFKNGSYGKTIENTTICYRTLAYIDFTNEVKKRIGRPLTVDESFLASQMLYDIASDPQCLYCYVSLDRKAYDGFLLEYTEQMNSVIEGYNALEVKDKQSIDSLYKDFLNGRKDTKPMKARFNMWLDVAKSNSDVISLEDLTTEEVRAKIINDGGAKAKQITDAERYAQSASWAKKLEQYRSYNGEILKMSPEIVKKLNSHYGLRFYSFSEYTPAFIAENMQQIRDASLRGLYGLGYTKETDFATIFAPTGMNINMSVFGKMSGGEVVPDTRQGANWDAVKDLRNEHKNVGAVFVATNDALVDWALNQDWIDVVIPFHIVRTGASVAEFYKWTNNTKFQADKDASGKNKTISPTEHHNDFETFKRLVEERGLTPRFDKWFDNPNYMKLVNETRLSVDESSKLVPVFNLDGAKESFDNFVGKGGYYGNWYKDGVDFDRAVDIVANDVLAGKKANDDTVDYGRQDLTDEQIAELKKRNKPRTHGHAIAPVVDSDIAPTQYSLSEVDNKYADTFYSQMAKVVDGIKQEKLGADSVVNMLRGKGVKAEEIKWSGIETWLVGKKSVTKAELQEFIAGSQLQIEEELNAGGNKITLESSGYGDDTINVMLGGQVFDTVTWNSTDEMYISDSSGLAFLTKEKVLRYYQDKYGNGNTRWSGYALNGGENYRELVFKMPNSTFNNAAMKAHWGEDAKGILAHARIQDMTNADGKKMLFIEEIQSDWHNEGQKEGYLTKLSPSDKMRLSNLREENRKLFAELKQVDDNEKFDEIYEKRKSVLAEIEALEGKEGAPPDAPFRTTYHEYVLKRLLRMAAEEGYDSIGWTTADIQSNRWSNQYAEGYRIEYDQDIPSFLKKYGKKWGATVGKTQLPGLNSKETYYDVNREETFDNFAVWQDTVRTTIDQQGGDSRNVLFGMDGNDWIAYDKHTGLEYDRAKVSKTSDLVWSMDITESMKQSVLYEGQPKYSLSEADDIAPIGRGDVFGKDFRVREDIAPVTENVDGVNQDVNQDVNQTVNQNVDAPMENVDENVENVDTPAETVEEKISKKLENFKTELANNERLREEANANFDAEIARLQAEYDAKKKKDTKVANDLLRRIERMQRLKNNVDADYDNRITSLKEKIEKLGTPEYKRGEQRKAKQQEYTEEISEMIGDTSTWQDKKMGLSYQTNTLHRNLRDVVRDEKGNRDIAKADEIYEYLQGAYNHHEAQLKLESRDIKKPLAELNLNKYESQYAQMLGEFKYNPGSKLSKDTVDEYYNKHKNKIDTKRVDKAIEYTRETYDALIKRVNEVLREQGMKEIPYRQGYFPHFMDEKQGFLAKLFNWKTQNNDIPTDIAGLTETFEPNRSWQSFNKQRTSDTTDYNLLRGFDTYVHGALDWIYHIEDIQKRRALENEIRYRHSEQGIKDKIDKIKKNTEYDADEAQELMDAVYKEARNPLNNFVTDLRNGTNNLAGKKSSEDRNMEYMTNRKIYSTMTNLSNRVTANMVAGSVSSALTNFIPITQSWGQVSPISSLKATKDMIKNAIRSDGMIEKSDFMTNRLIQEENLNQTGWDKAGKVVGSMMEIADRISTEVVWRSKYMENMKNGMSENEAIHNADIFAENVMAGRSRGNAPTLFNAKNPAAKMFTAFQLEVANQYGYMFKDMPQDIGKKNIGKLVKGYAGVFVGAYVYNALYSALTGRDAAFSPLDILEDIFKDLGLGDDEEEEVDVLGAVQGLAENVAQEVPFVGGLFGGGRIPISSALPYELSLEGFNNFTTDVNGMLNEEDNEKYTKSFFKEMMKPVWYVGLPMGGGQIKKTTEGLSMFSEDIGPVAGSYTNSGNLRFPVEDTPWNRIQAGIFGQYSSANAREYFDEDYAPLSPNQTQEYADVGMGFTEYHKYRDGLKKLNTLAEKFDYIDSLDLTVEQKNILINNIVDRDEPVDMTGYGNYGHYEEFDFATKNPEKYNFFKSNNISYESYVESEESKEAYNWAYNNPEKYQVSKAIGDVITYRQYSKDLSNLQADKDKNGNSISGSRKKKVVAYINSLNADYGAKIILYKLQYESDDRYNKEIVEYLNGRDDISYMQMVIILRELGMNVDANGKVTWN